MSSAVRRAALIVPAVACTAAVVLILGAVAPMWEASRTRSYQLERQNLSPEEGKYTWSEFEGLLRLIGRDNEADPLGYQATLKAFGALGSPPGSILELGPGSGGFGRLLARQYPSSSVLGIDASNASLRVAESSGELPANLRFEHRSSEELTEPPASVDVITTTFVNHEIFPDASFVDFLRRVRVIGRQAFIFNDFVRSFGCLSSMVVLGRAVNHGRSVPGVEALLPWLPEDKRDRAAVAWSTPGPVVDFGFESGVLSMKRSFTMREYKALFREAGYPEGSLVCSRDEGFYWQDFLGEGCRVVCTANLSTAAV